MASEEATAVGQLLAAEGINGVKRSEGVDTAVGQVLAAKCINGVNSSEGVDTAVGQLLAAWTRRCMHTYTCTYVSLCKHHTSYM